MFDDKPIASPGVAPQNLPVSEPEDLFAQTEADSGPRGVLPNGQPFEPTAASPNSPSALDAGILKPKEQPPLPPLSFGDQGGIPPVGSAPAAEYQSSMNPVKEPTLSRGILVVIVVIVAVLLIGGAGWWVYRYLNVPQVAAPISGETDADVVVPEKTTEDTPSDSSTSSNETTPSDVNDAPLLDETASTSSDVMATSTQPVDETILFGEATDTDSDGLDDRREQSLGTNPEKADTDADELTDGDEVIIWGTNPLNPDTDGDTFLDGKEIKAGFSPKGSGKLFEVKSTSTSTVTSP